MCCSHLASGSSARQQTGQAELDAAETGKRPGSGDITGFLNRSSNRPTSTPPVISAKEFCFLSQLSQTFCYLRHPSQRFWHLFTADNTIFHCEGRESQDYRKGSMASHIDFSELEHIEYLV